MNIDRFSVDAKEPLGWQESYVSKGICRNIVISKDVERVNLDEFFHIILNSLQSSIQSIIIEAIN